MQNDMMAKTQSAVRKTPLILEQAQELESAVRNLDETLDRLYDLLNGSGLLGPTGVGSSTSSPTGAKYSQPVLILLDTVRERVDTATRRIIELVEALPV